MSIKTKLLIYFLIIFAVFSTLSIFSVYKNKTEDESFKKDLVNAINFIEASAKQSTLAQLVRYDDEVLTQSARNYAFTGDSKWKDRYYEFVPKLDLRIKEALALGDDKDQEIFNRISNSNLALIKLEEEAISLVGEKKNALAQKILNSQEYSDQKTLYQAGINEYIARHGLNIDATDPAFVSLLKNSEAHFLNVSKAGTLLIWGLILIFLLAVIFLFWIIVITFMKPLIIFKGVAREIINGNLNATVKIKNRDEIGEFASDFNQMTKNLKDSIENIEHKVIEKTKDLDIAKKNLEKALFESDRMNKLMVGRELEMINLKKQILDLKKDK